MCSLSHNQTPLIILQPMSSGGSLAANQVWEWFLSYAWRKLFTLYALDIRL